MRTLPLFLLMACAPAPADNVAGDDDDASDTDLLTFGDDDDDDDDTDTATTGGTTLDGEYHGTLPGFELAAPEFNAINRDGGARAQPDLIGHPTVMWFFPLAGTPG